MIIGQIFSFTLTNFLIATGISLSFLMTAVTMSILYKTMKKQNKKSNKPAILSLEEYTILIFLLGTLVGAILEYLFH